MAAERATEHMTMAGHPDIMAMRARYDETSETPVAWLVEGLTFLAGLYAAGSAWIAGFASNGPALAQTNLIVGIGIALLAYGFTTNYAHTHGLSWVVPVLGVWLIIAPWVVRNTDRTGGMDASNVIIGIVVLVLGLATTYPSMRHEQG